LVGPARDPKANVQVAALHEGDNRMEWTFAAGSTLGLLAYLSQLTGLAADKSFRISKGV